ncbi:MAG: helix-turn-helix domain-containing protein [Xanthomonadales bacterium]|nr:helix-turn-helix domain-containing protein [Xanthomonadales bacterium]
MTKEKPSYYAVITADVRYNHNLKPNEKLLFAEITALTQKNGYCHASNRYFAELYNVSNETVSRWISNLKKENFIDVIIERNDKKEVIKRYITLLTKKSIPSRQKNQYPIDKKVKENTTSNNNTSIIKEKSKPKKKFQKPTHAQVAEYLKEKQQQLDIDYFIDYYESKDWMIGKNRMKNWKSAINNWLRNEKNYATNKQRKLTQAERTEIAVNELLNG